MLLLLYTLLYLVFQNSSCGILRFIRRRSLAIIHEYFKHEINAKPFLCQGFEVETSRGPI